MIQTNSLEGLGILPSHKILIVMPHPDDEAVFVGGLMKLLSTSRIPVKLLTITRGEASTHRFGLAAQDNLADHRTGEVQRAAAILGITDVTVCAIPDGHITDSKQIVLKQLRDTYSSFAPTHLITLEPDGVYGHPDHIGLSQFVTESAPPHTKVLYATVKPGFISSPSAAKMAKKSHISPIAPQYELTLSPLITAKKIMALHAHKTQFRIGLLHWVTLITFQVNLLLTREYFTYALRK